MACQKKNCFVLSICIYILVGGLFNCSSKPASGEMENASENTPSPAQDSSGYITLFMCGDVMLGRGIDQILSHPSDPVLYESYVKDAREYVKYAEDINGPISQPVTPDYVWGDALDVLNQKNPDIRIINLETSITKSKNFWKGKSVNYKMNPENISCLEAAKIDFCALANNHTIDWGYEGLKETLKTLREAKIQFAGAGQNIATALSPSVFLDSGKGRVLIFSFGFESSGIPPSWSASENEPGVNVFNDLSEKTINKIRYQIEKVKQKGDLVIVSIHWGGNWGYRISDNQAEFAHALIDRAEVDVIHGHSSHHVKGIEVYKNKPILYGCGDFLNDYEGIGGHEEFRSDLSLMYFVTMDSYTGKLIRLEMVPTQVKRFQVNKTSPENSGRLKELLNRESKKFGTEVKQTGNQLVLSWK